MKLACSFLRMTEKLGPHMAFQMTYEIVRFPPQVYIRGATVCYGCLSNPYETMYYIINYLGSFHERELPG